MANTTPAADLTFSEERRYEYALDPLAVVLDVGAYDGSFARTIAERYGCLVYSFEPVRRHLEILRGAVPANVEVLGFGVGASDRRERIAVAGDGSSIFRAPAPGWESEEIEIRRLAGVLETLDLSHVDLLKLNVEGCECEILEHLLDEGLAERFENIQVQFHDLVDGAAERRTAIRARLAKTHRITYEEPFVWENHERLSARYPLAVATLFHDEARFLQEWIEYHRIVGVEHFWLYNDRSSDGFEDVLAPYIRAGLVEVIEWPVADRNYLMGRQVEAQRDAIVRARGRARWLALIDVDEYLLALEHDTVVECLDDERYGEAAAVYANWKNFGTGGVHLRHAGPTLSSLTACAEPLHPRNSVGKSIVRPEHVLAERHWYPHHAVLKPGRAYHDGDGAPIPSGADGPALDGKNHASLIRVNHYPMRDESFFRSFRLGFSNRFVLDHERLAWEHYGAFSRERDERLLEILSERHPAAYDAFWGRPEEEWPKLGPFVSARLLGRLGNNMFQIAAASALAWENGAEPVFPELDPNSAHYEHVLFRCNVGPDMGDWTEWREPSYAYAPIDYRPNLALAGYYQSERYFAGQRERIRALFRPKAPDAEHIDDVYGELLARPNTVGVQLRYYRDEDPETYPQYGARYLELAAAHFPASSVFVISSDNLAYARASIPSRMRNVVVLEGEPDYIDLFVLSRCRHNIIGNSSFGWWAAWLNESPRKVVIRPERWVNGLPYQDVCPPRWISLSAPEG